MVISAYGDPPHSNALMFDRESMTPDRGFGGWGCPGPPAQPARPHCRSANQWNQLPSRIFPPLRHGFRKSSGRFDCRRCSYAPMFTWRGVQLSLPEHIATKMPLERSGSYAVGSSRRVAPVLHRFDDTLRTRPRLPDSWGLVLFAAPHRARPLHEGLDGRKLRQFQVPAPLNTKA